MTSWDTATSGYDAQKHYTQASDKRGHSVPIKSNFPTTIAAQISNVIAGGYIDEYRNQNDLIRDAVVHHLQGIAQRFALGELERTISMHVIHSDAMQKREARETFGLMMTEIIENCHYYSQKGRTDELRQYVADLLDQAQVIPAEHREEFVGQLEGQLKVTGGL